MCLRRFPVGTDSLKVKKIIKVKFLWIKLPRLDVSMSGRMCSWKNTQGIFFVVPWVCLRSLSASTMAFCVYIRQSNDNEFREIKLRLVKFDLETLLFNKAHFCEVLYLLQWVSFSGKDYYVLLLVLLILNKFSYWFYWFWISSLK